MTFSPVNEPEVVNLYHLLGVSEDATSREIRTAYKRQAKLCHPDKNEDSAESTRNFQKIVEAYDVLSDAVKRANHDRLLRRERARKEEERRHTSSSTSTASVVCKHWRRTGWRRFKQHCYNAADHRPETACTVPRKVFCRQWQNEGLCMHNDRCRYAAGHTNEEIKWDNVLLFLKKERKYWENMMEQEVNGVNTTPLRSCHIHGISMPVCSKCFEEYQWKLHQLRGLINAIHKIRFLKSLMIIHEDSETQSKLLRQYDRFRTFLCEFAY